MIKIDTDKNEKIHTRRIEVATYDCGQQAIIVEGKLKDDRLQSISRPTGEQVPPGTVHHMIIRMQVRGPKLTIEDIEVEMPTVPYEECIETLTSLEPVKGMHIASGFTNDAKELVGGAKGCAHLVALLVSMASAAVQGAWTAVSRRPADQSAYRDRAIDAIVDTCRVWRKDGPKFKKYRSN
ncbi:MAG: DUF2889 domain-containing protein [Deltaproteobacteria bacterium]|nr:DUF2889 domain-containing protein [Deltaproteobacteria bacterium]